MIMDAESKQVVVDTKRSDGDSPTNFALRLSGKKKNEYPVV